MRKALFTAVLAMVIAASGVSVARSTHDSPRFEYPQVSNLPSAAMSRALFDKRKVWASVILPVDAGGLTQVYYVVYWDEVRAAYREFIGFHYIDPHYNIFFVRSLGGRIDIRTLGGGIVEENIPDPQADRLFDEVKKHLDVEWFIRNFIEAFRPSAWPSTWPPASE